jgi:hypothetical protein
VQIDIGKQKVVWILKHRELDEEAVGNTLHKGMEKKKKKKSSHYISSMVSKFPIPVNLCKVKMRNVILTFIFFTQFYAFFQIPI